MCLSIYTIFKFWSRVLSKTKQNCQCLWDCQDASFNFPIEGSIPNLFECLDWILFKEMACKRSSDVKQKRCKSILFCGVETHRVFSQSKVPFLIYLGGYIKVRLLKEIMCKRSSDINHKMRKIFVFCEFQNCLRKRWL